MSTLNITRAALKRAWLLGCLTLSACTAQADHASPCLSADDCEAGQLCRLDRCVLIDASLHTDVSPRGDASDAADLGPVPTWPQRDDAKPETPDDATDQPQDMGSADAPDQADWPGPVSPQTQHCLAQAKAPSPGELIIHEVLANVPAGPEGDANQDGVRDAYDDEFVELLNLSDQTLDLHGIQLTVGERAKYTFSQECLAPGQGAVIFGGPKDAPPMQTAEGALVRYAPARLSLSNTQGSVGLVDKLGRGLFLFEYDAPKMMSYSLEPQRVGTRFVPHDALAPRLFSPGYCADGSPLIAGCDGAASADEDAEP